MLLKEILFPTKKAIEYSYAAFRVNGGYKKDIGDDDGSNRTLILNSLCTDYAESFNVPLKEILYTNSVTTLVVTEADKEAALRVDEKLKMYSFYIIGDRLTEFQKRIFTVASQEMCNVRSLNVIASLPQTFSYEDVAKEYARRLKTEFSNSEYLTDVEFKDEVEVLKRIYVKDHGYYMYICGTKGNLIRFTSPNKIDEKFLNIKGRFKNKEIERDFKLNLTRLNYVRIL